MHLSTVKVPIDFGLGLIWPSISFLILKPIFFLTSWLLLWCQILMSGLSTRVIQWPSLTHFNSFRGEFVFLRGWGHSPALIGLGGGLVSICGRWWHSPPVYLLFGAMYWSSKPDNRFLRSGWDWGWGHSTALCVRGGGTQVNATGPYSWCVNISSGNGSVTSGNKPLPNPILTEVLWHHMASVGHNEIIY